MGDINWQYIIYGTVALYGLYVLVSAIKMKTTGQISSFVASQEELYKCKDKKGLAKSVADKMMQYGVFSLVFGLVNIVNEMIWKAKIFQIVTLGLFLLACYWFIMHLRKARGKFMGL